MHASTHDVVDMKCQQVKEAQLRGPSAKLRDKDVIEIESWDKPTSGTNTQNYWNVAYLTPEAERYQTRFWG